MKRVRVATDHWNFELEGTGQFITPLGGNVLDGLHPVQGTLFDQFDAGDCDRRLGRMAELGLNCLRQPIGVNRVFDPLAGLLAGVLKNWDTFIDLCQRHGIYLMPVGGYIGGNDWFDMDRLVDSGRALDESCAFWEAFAGHYAGHPAIWAWDLRNELLYDNQPVIPGAASMTKVQLDAKLKENWPQWLQSRYGSVAAMNRAYASSYDCFEQVPGSVRFMEKPFDLCAYDFRCYLNDRGYEWCRRQCQVIRRVDPQHMICQGNNTWLNPDMDLWLANGFHNHVLHDLFDFVTFHPYPAWNCLPEGHGDPLNGGEALAFWLNCCAGMARYEGQYGKPVVVQEFGWYGGGTSRFIGDLPYRSEQEHACYTDQLMAALSPHVNGFLNWPVCDMPQANDISNHGGIFTHDGQRKALARTYGDWAQRFGPVPRQRALGTMTLRYSLLGLYTSREYQDQMWQQIHQIVGSGHVPDIRFV